MPSSSRLSDAGLALARQHQADDLVEPRQVVGLHGLEEALEVVLPLGKLHDLGVGAAELEPDLDHALGRLVGDLLEAVADLLGDRLGQLLAHLVLGRLGLHLRRR